jgi:hypothetical protein
MTMEQRLRDVGHGSETYHPAPDLFAKVKRSIHEDGLHRRRVRRVIAGCATFAAVIIAWLAVWWNPQPDASPLPWWSLVAVVVALEIAIVGALGPAIRRYGRAYVADVFRTSQGTGTRFLSLFDVAYYLVFIGLVLTSIPFADDPAWMGPDGLARLLEEGSVRVGLLLLAMGVLHAITIFVLPMVGLVFAANRHRTDVHQTKDEWAPEVRRAHRTVNITLIVLGIWIVINVIPLLILQFIGLAFGI